MRLAGDFVRREHFWLAEEVSLKIEKPAFAGGEKLFARFHFFRQHAAMPGPVTLDQSCPLFAEVRCRSTLMMSAISVSGSGVVAAKSSSAIK